MKRNIWDKLVDWSLLADKKPLILNGARQVGKTYILKAFGDAHYQKVHYLNFEQDLNLNKAFQENLSPKVILERISIYLNASIDKDKDLIIFDEIQESPRALTSLKYFYEEMPGVAICAAGSLLGIHLSKESFPVGKVDFLHIYPLSFSEFLQGSGESLLFDFLQNYKHQESVPEIIHARLWDQLKIYFIVGGLPDVVNTYTKHKDDLFNALIQVRQKQNNLIITYIADMAKHSGKQNAMHIERLWRNVPAQLAKEFDGSATKFKFKGIIPGISRYSKLAGSLDWLVASGLIIKTHIVNSGLIPFSAYASENSFKLYVLDVGILGALSQLPPKIILDYDYGSYKGYFAENYVAQEFVCSGAKDLHCWKGKTAEVEFLREINGDVFPIEVKSGWKTQSKSLKVFYEKYQCKQKTILSANNFRFDVVNNVYHFPLYLAAMILDG